MKKHRYLLLVAKLVIASLAILFIYFKLNAKENAIGQMMNEYNNWNWSEKIGIILILSFMTIINWLLEALKWKKLLQNIVNIKIWQSFAAVLSGVTISIFTPNRVGEFAGRILHLDPAFRVRGALASVAGSMNQLLITVSVGGLSLCAYIYLITGYSTGEKVALITGLILVVVSFCWIYFKISRLPTWLKEHRWALKVNEYLDFFRSFSFHLLAVVTSLSLTRYVVFTFQYIILLHEFGVNESIPFSFMIISVTYFITSLVPGFALSELALRGSVAVYLFVDQDPVNVLAASTGIWLLNIVVPGIFGALSAFYFKFKQ